MDLNDCIVTGDCIKTVYTCKRTTVTAHKTTSQTSILFTCASKATVD